MPGEHYVYELIDPRDGAVFYVGKGKGKRYAVHEKEARGGKYSRKCALIRDILADGLSYDVRIVSRHLVAADAYDAEAQHIEQIGLCELTNVTPGGSGGYEIYRTPKPLSPEQIVRKTAPHIRKIMFWGTFFNVRIGGVEVLQDAVEFCMDLRKKVGADRFDDLVKPHPVSLIALG